MMIGADAGSSQTTPMTVAASPAAACTICEPSAGTVRSTCSMCPRSAMSEIGRLWK